MAKDVTIRVTGTNPDGTINVQMPDGGNPFMGGGAQTGAIVPYNPQRKPARTDGRIPRQDREHGSDVRFEADFPESRQGIP